MTRLYEKTVYRRRFAHVIGLLLFTVLLAFAITSCSTDAGLSTDASDTVCADCEPSGITADTAPETTDVPESESDGCFDGTDEIESKHARNNPDYGFASQPEPDNEDTEPGTDDRTDTAVVTDTGDASFSDSEANTGDEPETDREPETQTHVHEFGDWQIVTESPDCVTAGEAVRSCVCGETERKSTEAPGHKAVVAEAKAATCTQTGNNEGTVCSVCGTVLTGCETVPATGHRETVKAGESPTCEQPGKTELVYCEICGAVIQESEEIPMTGHIPVTVERIEPTCTDAGRTSGTVCAVCGKWILPSMVIPPAGHNPGETAIENTVLPECTRNGKQDEVTYCLVCGSELSRWETVLPALGHSPVTVLGTPPTCTQPGLTDATVCSVCNGLLSGMSLIPPIGHKPGVTLIENTVQPTCENPGSYDEVLYCAVCGTPYESETFAIQPTGHEPGIAHAENLINPGCLTNGGYDSAVYCNTCGKELERSHTVLDPVGHTPGDEVQENPVAPDCVTPGGYDAVVYCAVCRYELSRIWVEVKETGHKPGIEQTENRREPDCINEGGYDTVTYCSVCGCETGRVHIVIAKLEHDAIFVNGVSPTCTGMGLTESAYCRLCGTVLIEQRTIPATGHSSEKVTGYSPTCTEPGLTDGERCTICNVWLENQTEIPAPGHTPGGKTQSSKTEATYLLPGETEYVINCRVCGLRLDTQTETVQPLKYQSSNLNSLSDTLYRGIKNHEESIDISKYNLNNYTDGPSVLNSVLQDLQYLNAELFYWSNTYQFKYNSSGKILSVQPTYLYDKNRYVEMVQDYEKRVRDILNQLPEGATEFETILFFHDYIVSHFDYDMRLYSTDKNEKSKVVYDAYGLLTQGVGVCQAYSLLYTDLLSRCGIEVTYAQSNAMTHIWNVVVCDGKTYHVDVTWDDPSRSLPGTVLHTYFLLTDTEMKTASNPHYNWVCTETCRDGTYSEWWGRDVTSNFVKLSGLYYAVDGTDIVVSYDLLSPSYDVEVSLEPWCKYNSPSMYYASRAFTGLFATNGRLLYNTMTQVILYDPDAQNTADRYTVLPVDAIGGFIYGCNLDGDTLRYAVAKSAEYTDIVSRKELTGVSGYAS